MRPLLLAMILVNQIQGILGNVHAAEVFVNNPVSAPNSIDGVSLVSGRKYLLCAQANAVENGVWVYNGSALVRPTSDENLRSGVEMILGSEIQVQAGEVHEGERFRLVRTDSTTLDGYENLVVVVGTHKQFWRRAGNRPGEIVSAFAATYPGALLLDGDSTIGSAASGADYTGPHLEEAFEVVRLLAPNVSPSFAGNDPATLPDGRGRVIGGRDDMGGTAANRLTSAVGGVDGATLGAGGGAQSHLLTSNQSGLREHGHNISANQVSTAGGSGAAPRLTGLSNGDEGNSDSGTTLSPASDADEAHPNVQPTLVANLFLCL